jgi:hypothetical protein
VQLTFRMLPPPAVGKQTLTVNGRTYSAAPGTAVDVLDSDARVLAANSWVICAPSGATAQRPTTNPNVSAPYTIAPSFEFFDTTLSKLIFWDGQSWRDPANGNAV